MVNASFPLAGRHLTKAELFSGPIRPHLVNGSVRAWVSKDANPRLEDMIREEVHHLVVTHGPNQAILRQLLEPHQDMPSDKTHAWWQGERYELPGDMLHTTLALRTDSAESTEPDLAVKIIDEEFFPPGMILKPAKILSHLVASGVPCVKLLGYTLKDRARRPDATRRLEYPARGQFFVQWEKKSVPLNDKTVRPLFNNPEKRRALLRQLGNLFAFFHGKHNPYATNPRKAQLEKSEWDILINDCKLENFLFVPDREEGSRETGVIKVLDPEVWEIRKKSDRNDEEKDLDVKNILTSAYKDGLVRDQTDVEEFIRQYVGLHLKAKQKDQNVQAKAWKLTQDVMTHLAQTGQFSMEVR